MADAQVTRRYAQALCEEADRQGHLSQVDDDADLLLKSLDEAPELERVLKSPVVPQDKKRGVLAQLVKPRVSGLTYRFVELLLDKDREEEMGAMLRAYRTLRDRQEGIIEADVRAAQPLDDEARSRLEDAVSRITSLPNVRLNVAHAPDLIGGVVVRVGDTVYDGSVRHQLQSLHERLAHEADVSDALESSGDGEASEDESGGDASSDDSP